MARFLLLARPTGRSGRVRGDPVGYFEDGTVFPYGNDKSVWLASGRSEADWPNTFMILDVPGVSVEEASRMMEEHKRPAVEGDPMFGVGDPEDRYVTLGRHRWNFDIDGRLPQQAIDNMNSNGRAGIARAILNSLVIDRSGLDDVFLTDTPKEV